MAKSVQVSINTTRQHSPACLCVFISLSPSANSGHICILSVASFKPHLKSLTAVILVQRVMACLFGCSFYCQGALMRPRGPWIPMNATLIKATPVWNYWHDNKKTLRAVHKQIISSCSSAPLNRDLLLLKERGKGPHPSLLCGRFWLALLLLMEFIVV